MPRPLIALVLAFVASGLSAQDFGVPEPVWTLRGPTESVVAGRPFTVTAEVRLPAGYYQDADSPFLSFEPSLPVRVLERSHSAATVRRGKESFTGTFTLTRLVVLDEVVPGSSPLSWKAGWQICQVDGVCLLPAERSLPLTVSGAVSVPGLDFWAAMAGALLGGLLLNLMPCVFPVLALKAVGVAATSGLTRRDRRREALAFAAGGFGTVMALGLVTAGFSALGHRLDWGFTFQEPLFVWALVLVFWVFALQLWGVWTWPGSPFTISASPRAGWPRALGGGALLVLVAAPCTAPLLGPALGFAFSQPPALIPLFFAAAGLGLVLPLLVLQAVPGWTKLLPRPGAWMVVVERIAGFFLAATVVYLLWVFTRQTADDKVWPALGVLGLVAATLAWAGQVPRSWTVRILAGLVFVGAVAGGVLLAPFAGSVQERVAVPGWTPFSAAALEAGRASGRPVLVDATAAWCATCQVNELAVLDRPDVTALIDRLGILRLRADYTRPDPAIRAWLVSVGRAGLPVYALYTPGTAPYLFPELLTDDNFTRLLPRLVGRRPVAPHDPAVP